MTDRELLEKAARAMGVKWRWFGATFCTEHDPEMDTYRPWNPLESDADALRLAVKLNISLWISPGNVVRANFRDGGEVTVVAGHDLGAPDKAAATRRAIVRAAAIGEQQ